MRVLVVSQYFWPERFRINDMVEAFASRGISVTVLTGMPNYGLGRLFDGYEAGWFAKRHDRFGASRVYRLPLFLRRQSRGWQLALNYLSFVLSGCLVGPWLLRGQDFDAIFVYAPSPITACIPAVLLRILKRAPIFFWVQDLWPESLEATGAVRSPTVLRLVSKIVRWIYAHCDRVLVPSHGFVEPVVAAGASRAKVRYLPNWAESYYRPLQRDPDIDAALPIGFRLMFAGNLGEAQALDTILDAAERLRNVPEIKWLIVGDGRRGEWLKQQIAEQNLSSSIHLLGQHPSDEMPAYFASADALLVTLKREEIFAYTIPSKVQTYLACGRPLLGALDGEGARVIMEANAGLAVPAEDGVALADAALRLYEMDAAERHAMGLRGREYYERHFQRDGLLDKLEQEIREMAENSARA